MERAHGKFCGGFKPPKVPFQSQPFFGHYARSGGKDLGGTTDPTSPAVPTTPQQAPTEPETDGTAPDTGDGNGNDTPQGGADDTGAAFDPNQYETPPQSPPDTGAGQAPSGGTQAPGDG
jgi:hypothetical protein